MGDSFNINDFFASTSPPLPTFSYEWCQVRPEPPLRPHNAGNDIKIINPVYPIEEVSKVFHPFPCLPPEIRLSIWTEALRGQRLIPVSIRIRSEDEPPESPGGEHQTREAWQAVLCCQKFYSKLLRVNRDSRLAALSFYRVRVSCHAELVTPEPERTGRPSVDNTRPIVLYFNPEYDTLYPRVTSAAGTAEFLSKFKAADPRGVGVRVLAMEAGDMQALNSCSSSRDVLEPNIRGAVGSILADLDSMLLVCRLSDSTKSTWAFSCNPPGGPQPPPLPPHNRSVPILAGTASFENLGPDPRPITKDMRLLATTSGDARRSLLAWRQLLHTYRLPAPPSVSCRYMCFGEPNYVEYFDLRGRVRIRSREAARAYLQQREEAAQTKDKWRPWSPRDHESVPNEMTEKEEDEEEGPKFPMAIGFWLFPLDAMGEPSEMRDTQANMSVRWLSGCDLEVVNLEKNWPELCVFVLH